MTHGQHSSYTHGKCRCDLCYEAHRSYMRAYRQANRERLLTYERGRSSLARDDPAKRRARKVAWYGKRTPQPCEVCGSPGQRHHDDYDKPLEIRWLCLAHHGEAHRT